MLQIIIYVLALVVGSITLNSLEFSSGDAETAVTVVFYIIYTGWGIGLVCFILEVIKDQINDLNKIGEETSDKQSYERELVLYKEEMQIYLTKDFPLFEERIIKNISDSQALATIIEKEGYQKILSQYDNRISQYLNKIEGRERSIARLIKNLKSRQEDKLGFGIFIPAKYHYLK